MCVSSKLYSALAAGMPVLAIVGGGDEVARFVRECDCDVEEHYQLPHLFEVYTDLFHEIIDQEQNS